MFSLWLAFLDPTGRWQHCTEKSLFDIYCGWMRCCVGIGIRFHIFGGEKNTISIYSCRMKSLSLFSSAIWSNFASIWEFLLVVVCMYILLWCVFEIFTHLGRFAFAPVSISTFNHHYTCGNYMEHLWIVLIWMC